MVTISCCFAAKVGVFCFIKTQYLNLCLQATEKLQYEFNHEELYDFFQKVWCFYLWYSPGKWMKRIFKADALKDF